MLWFRKELSRSTKALEQVGGGGGANGENWKAALTSETDLKSIVDAGAATVANCYGTAIVKRMEKLESATAALP